MKRSAEKEENSRKITEIKQLVNLKKGERKKQMAYQQLELNTFAERKRERIKLNIKTDTKS